MPAPTTPVPFRPAPARPASGPPRPVTVRRATTSAGPADAIVVEALHKTYANGTHAVRGIDIRVRRGEVFGILGPNGAGKSTTIGVLGTLVRPSQGRALVDGIDVTRDADAVRRRIGFAMQEAGVDNLATGREFLVLQARLYGVPKEKARQRAQQLLKLFELDDAADRRIGTYSGGMKRRVDLAAALIHGPRILFLDEPTEGLDPRSRRTMWETLRRLNKEQGITVLLSTHYMEEADALCHRLAIIDQGRIVAEGAPDKLKAAVGGSSVMLEWGPATDPRSIELAQKALTSAGVAPRVARTGSTLRAYTPDAAASAPRILRALDAAGVPPASVQIHQPTLEDVYLRHTGKQFGAETGGAG